MWQPFLAALAILILPGIGVGLASGLRAMAVIALAPVLSIGVISITAIIAPYFGLSWGPTVVLLATGIVSAISWVLRALIAKKLGCSRHALRWSLPVTPTALLGFAIGAIVILYRLLRIFVN